MLFIPYGIRQRDSQLIETYVDRDFYIAEYETLVQTGLLDDGVLDVTLDASFPVKILPEMSHKQLADTIFRLGEKITLLNPTPEYDADEEAEEKEERVES